MLRRLVRAPGAAIWLALLLVAFFSTDGQAQQTCPCSIWNATATPGPMDSETAALEVGVKFKSDAPGFVTGIRFYKYSTNTGTHVGNLWSSTGALLGTATFTNETASGWQQANFAAPVAINANTTYVASYHLNVGHYAATVNGFTAGVDNAPLHALSDASGGGNGVFAASASSVFPTLTWNASNYWVDVVLSTDTTPPTVTASTPANGAVGVAPSTTVTATFSEAMNASTITTSTVTLKNPANATVAATLSYNTATLTATLTPTAALAPLTTYTATVTGGASGVKDAVGNALASNFVWSFTTAPDTTAPTVTQVTPTSGATGVAVGTTVTAKFSEAMAASSITTSTVTLQAPSSPPIAATVSYNATTFVATLTPSAPLANLTTYTATVTGGASGVTDVAGNPLASNVVWSFTTVADTTRPTVAAVTPTSGSTNVNAGTSVTARFSEAMNASTINTTTITLKNPSSVTVAATVTYDAATFTATLTPTAALANTTTYTATITSGTNGVKDVAGNALASNFVWSFTTAADSVPPTVTGVTPLNGATGVAQNTTVTATFSETMTASTITATTLVLKDSTNATVTATVTYNAATLTATLTPSVQLASLTTYTATVTGGASGVKDAAGNALASNFVWSFTTVVDTTPPTVTQVTPASGATGVAIGAAVTVKFSEPMALSTLTSTTITLKDPTSAPVAATVSYNAATLVATLTPSAPLAYLTTYTATVTGGTGGVTDAAGNALVTNFVWSFTTAPDTTPPTVVAVTPTSGSTGVVIGAIVTARFSEAMNASTISATTVTLKNPSNVAVAATVTYNAATFTATLTPTAALAYSTTYTATITGGASGVKDAANNALASNFVWSFTTAADTTPPTVTGATPASGATGVVQTTTVTATFSETMTASTITTTTFVLKDSTNATVTATVAYNAATFVATLTPSAPLASLTTFTATVISGASGVKDAAGNALASNFVWSFTTAPDTTAPTVTSVIPAAGATAQLTSTTVTATFSEAMKSTTISGSTIVLKNSGGSQVTATVSYNAATFTATLTPSAPLANSTTYTATITGGAAGVTDVAGNPLAASYVWSFTTEAFNPCPCSIWTTTTTPGGMDTENGSLEVGLKFRSDNAGYITGLRFYKYAQNSGTHTASLWSSSGTLMGRATFVNETASGWQQVAFSAPIAIAANTTYVASYHTNTGFYASTGSGLANAVDKAPLHALSSGSSGGNGLFAPGPGITFPNQTYNSTNYWVDVVFNTVAADTMPPVVLSVSPSPGALGVSTGTSVTATFGEPMDASTMTASNFELRDASNALVTSTVTYSASTWAITLKPSANLAIGATYTATLKSTIRDVAGNSMAAAYVWSFTTAPASTPPGQGTGGPILVVTSSSNPFSQYYPEILRTEGFNAFNVVALSSVTASTLASYDVVILGEQALTTAQVTMFTTWVQGGGNLITFRPDKKLAALLGLSTLTTTSSDDYLTVDTTQAPGTGIVSQSMQFHGTADQYTLAGARAVATIYSDATHATTFPAVTLFTNGSGRAAAFTFDLAKSVIYTRQGNPAWAGQERDGQTPIRSDDLFFGASASDAQPDWVDLSKVAIPQADEQQRLLANLILLMNTKKPLPRFWYLPQARKAAVVMTGDDHGYGSTVLVTRLSGYVAQSPTGCQLDNWECIRATVYIFPNTPYTNTQVSNWLSQGFEFGLHGTMDPTWVDCGPDFTPSTLASNMSSELAQFKSKFPSAPAQTTHRQHCIMFSDWSTMPTTELANGIRFDTNYYYWPPTWINDTPGLFTGSGMPMRFASSTGAMIDVYQATTQMTDESGQTYSKTIDTLLDNAVGTKGYYGAFTANMHTDATTTQPMADAIVASAKSRGIPIVSSKQMLTWLDGRNNSTFTGFGWSANVLSFSVLAGSGANGLTMMVPTQFGALKLTGIKLNGATISYTTQTIKGVGYAFVTAAAGQYAATYAP